MTFAGFEGCIRYGAEARTSTPSARPQAVRRGFSPPTFLLCHCPPLGINDDPADPAHIGMEGLLHWVERHRAAPHPARPHAPDRPRADEASGTPACTGSRARRSSPWTDAVPLALRHGRPRRRRTREGRPAPHPVLAAAGHTARGLIRNPRPRRRPRGGGARRSCAIWSARTPSHVRGADAVVFAAGAGPGSGPERKRTVDLGGAVSCADAPGDRRRRYVMVSSMGATSPARPEAMRPYLRGQGGGRRACYAQRPRLDDRAPRGSSPTTRAPGPGRRLTELRGGPGAARRRGPGAARDARSAGRSRP